MVVDHISAALASRAKGLFRPTASTNHVAAAGWLEAHPARLGDTVSFAGHGRALFNERDGRTHYIDSFDAQVLL